ncbi:MAG: permease-like cell division protein FtsX [Muribaculaceae bacterium]|nr:permease-like cell division protein FtsX [Muribaculaceae bacterium]
MKKDKEVKISYWAAHTTTIVSVTLVLLILGLIALISVGARKETTRVRESLEVSVIMADSISNEGARACMESMKALPYCRNLNLITKEKALADWKADTGEDLEALFGVNPLSPEISFTMPEAYSISDSIAKIEKHLSSLPGVESIATPQGQMVEQMNHNITRLGTIMGGIALVLLIISFVLINNTVHLTVYARRFTIHTMQLVGATNAFIRRPMTLHNLLAGVLAGVIASALLWLAVGVAPKAGFSELQQVIDWQVLAVISGALILTGAFICAVTAAIATQHYLRKDYDELFR